MKINKNPIIHPFDVDETLITFTPIKGVSPITIKKGKLYKKAYPIIENIESLKESKIRGFFVRVHSAGGMAWAARVVRALKLEPYVDECETKSPFYTDDLPADKWMRRFFKGKIVE